MQITQEQFNEVHSWTVVTIPPEDWPNPRAKPHERTFYIANLPIHIPQYVIRRREFMRLACCDVQTIA